MAEKSDIYRELQKHLDKMPVGYPATESGVEIRILKYLFTPKQAELALYLKYQPQPLEKIYRKAKKLGFNIGELEKKLDEMFQQGLINYGKSGEEKFYANAPLAIGMYEYQLNSLTEDFVKDIYQYFEESFISEEWNKSGIPQLRTIPVEQSLTPEKQSPPMMTLELLSRILEDLYI